jgi:EAL domain-containing protein (putative c-di-GMP-specific phosphodiesterase class I)
MQSKAPDVGEVTLQELLAEVLAGDPSDGGFEVRYQPIVRLAGGATVAVEAVACWQHPQVGQVAPAQFVAAAEHVGL